MKRAACALLLLWVASGCRRSAPAATGLMVEEKPSQVFWSNATNRIGAGAYATVAAVVPGHPAGQLLWLDERLLAFMRLGGLDGPAEVDQAVLGAGGWSSPVAADFPGFKVTALLDGSALGGDPRRPMVVQPGSIPMTMQAATFGLAPVPIMVRKCSSRSSPNCSRP